MPRSFTIGLAKLSMNDNDGFRCHKNTLHLRIVRYSPEADFIWSIANFDRPPDCGSRDQLRAVLLFRSISSIAGLDSADQANSFAIACKRPHRRRCSAMLRIPKPGWATAEAVGLLHAMTQN